MDGTRFPTHITSQEGKPGWVQQHNSRNQEVLRRLLENASWVGQGSRRVGQDVVRIVTALVRNHKASGKSPLQAVSFRGILANSTAG